MSEEIRAVRVALGQFAQHFAAEEPLQWGMVVGPKTFRESDVNNLVLVSDISPFDAFLDNFKGHWKAGTSALDLNNFPSEHCVSQHCSGMDVVEYP